MTTFSQSEDVDHVHNRFRLYSNDLYDYEIEKGINIYPIITSFTIISLAIIDNEPVSNEDFLHHDLTQFDHHQYIPLLLYHPLTSENKKQKISPKIKPFK
jgi:hypothetical protein